MPRAIPFLLCVATVLGLSTAATATTTVPNGYDVVTRQELSSGVEYLKLTNPGAPVVAHVAHIAPGAPVDLRVVNAKDKIPTSSRDLETTSSMCGRVGCIVGVDGDFHTDGAPVGGVISDGRMMRSPNPARPQLTVTRDGHLTAGPLPWSATVVLGDGTRIPVSTVNATPGADSLGLYTPAYGGSRTDPSARTELLVKAADPGTLNRPTSLELRGIRAGGGAIPADGAVLSGDGTAGQLLQALWARVQQKTLPARAELRLESPVDASVSIGADPVVLRDGKRALPWNDPNLVNYQQPHTLVGWNKAGDTFLVAVDGRQAASAGVTMAQAADFLVGLGVTDAVNLDGGGGTVFVTGATVVNRPSDNNPTDPTRYVERGAANAFVVMSRPLPPPPPPPVSGPPGTVPGVSGAAPSGPATQTANPLGDLPSGPSVGVGGDAGSGDLPLGTAGSAPGGAAALAPARPAADGVLPVKAVGAAGAGDRSTGHGEAGKAAPGGGIHSTLSTVSTVAGDVISPLMGSGTPWRLGSRGDAAVAGTAVLLTAAWARRRFRGNPFDFGC